MKHTVISKCSFENRKTSMSPMLNMLIIRSKSALSLSNTKASAEDVTQVKVGGLLRLRSVYSLYICTSILPSSSRV